MTVKKKERRYGYRDRAGRPLLELASNPYAYEGVGNRRSLQSEQAEVDEPFDYFPSCGASLTGKNRDMQNF